MSIKLPVSQEELIKWFNDNIERIKQIDIELEKLNAERGENLYNLKLVLEVMKRIRAEGKKTLPLNVPPSLISDPRYKSTIGDAMEVILKEKGALRRREIIELLKQGGNLLKTKNPHIVIANAIKRDGKRRFIKLADKRIRLTTEKEQKEMKRKRNEKADEKG